MSRAPAAAPASPTAPNAPGAGADRAARRRPKSGAPLLPPAPRADLPLFFVVAIIVALACMAAISARSAFSAAQTWTAELQGAMTVHVVPGEDETPVAASMRAAETLADLPGVQSARPLSLEELRDLLGPWFAELGDAPAALIPGVVDVALAPGARVQGETLREALAADGFTAEVDDHRGWTRDVARAAGAARALALGVFLALLIAAVLVTSFATRASLSARADVVEVLHTVGASDEFIASEFTRRFLGLGVRAGLLGAVLAAAAGGAAMFLTRGANEDFLPSFAFAGIDVVILALAPLTSATVAAFTARETVLAALRRMY